MPSGGGTCRLKDVDGFWKTMRKMNYHNTVQANVIDGVTTYKTRQYC